MAASGRSDHYLSRKPVFIPVEWPWLSGEGSEVAVTVTLLKFGKMSYRPKLSLFVQEARHIIVPCSFLQPNVFPFNNLVPKSSLEPRHNSGKNDASFRENETYPYSESCIVRSNSCGPPDSTANDESKTYNPASLYCNLIDTKNFEEEITRNETSTIYENGQNNEYNYRSETNASINVYQLNQQKTLNSQLHEEKTKSMSVS